MSALNQSAHATIREARAIAAAQATADAIVRLIGLDSLVADYEFDHDAGHKYFLPGTVLIVKLDGSAQLVDMEGCGVTASYASSREVAELSFKVVGEDNGLVDMYQLGQYIASEPIG